MPGSVFYGVNASDPETPIPLATDAVGRLLIAIANPVEVTPTGDISHTIQGSVTVLDHWDYMAHIGRLFVASWLFPTVGNGAEAVLYIRPRANHYMHTKMAVSSGGAFHVILSEDPTVTVDGVVVAGFNLHRAYRDLAASRVNRTPTVTNHGTQLYVTQGGAGNKEPGVTAFAEWGLCHTHSYLLRAVNEAGAGQDMSLEVVFSEELCP